MSDRSEVPARPLATLQGPPGGIHSTLAIVRPVANVGQGAQNDVVLDDDTVSTRHARLEFADGGWKVTDLESRNGTYVDGQRLEPGVETPIRDGASLGFGAVRLTFGIEPDVDPSTVTAAEPQPTETRPARQSAGGFRLPVWLLLVILIVIAIIVFAIVTLSGGPPVTDPSLDAPAALMLVLPPPPA